jgi:adenylate cyclase
VSDAVFRDKVVFVGARILTKFASDRKDEYRSPFSYWATRDMVESGAIFISGVELQATAFLNLLRGDWLVRLPFATERALMLVLGALLGAGLVCFRPVAAAGLAMAGWLLTTAFFYLLYRQWLIWFPWLVVWGQIFLALSWSVLFNSIQWYVQKRVYEHTLALYLSPKLVKRFARNPSLLKPGAEKQTLTILFSDIAGFTSISEGMDSDELARVMNLYLENAVTHCIHATDGTVVKYIGDSIFAFWNAPEPQPDHAVRACRAALRFARQEPISMNGRPLLTRLGLHTGVANVGNFGSTDRVDYTALGENINLASRLEGVNKHLGTQCLISGATRREVGDSFVTRRLGIFRLKGLDKPVELHELVGSPEAAEVTLAWRDAFAAAWDHYRQKNWAAAEAGFRRTLDLRPSDGPARFYLAALAQLRDRNLPDNWNGELDLGEK